MATLSKTIGELQATLDSLAQELVYAKIEAEELESENEALKNHVSNLEDALAKAGEE